MPGAHLLGMSPAPTDPRNRRRLVALIAAGIALISLAVACWPGTPLVGMLAYSAAATLYLAYLGFAGGPVGPLLWPAVVLHLILTVLLARAARGEGISA